MEWGLVGPFSWGHLFHPELPAATKAVVHPGWAQGPRFNFHARSS